MPCRSNSWLLPLVLLAGSLWAGPAWATKVSYGTVPCPLDGTPSKVYTKVSSNTYGGYDSDLCTYSTHGQWREYAIATCPEDLYTVYGKDFARVHEEQTSLRLQQVVNEVRQEYPDAGALQVWDRYAIAVRFYRALGRDPAFIGELYHQASWVARDAAVGVYQGLEGPAGAKEVLGLGALELEKDLVPEARRTVTYNMALVAHRAGENQRREELLIEFEALPGLSETQREAATRMREMVEVEATYQDLAIEEYLAFLRRPTISHAEKVRISYLLADLLRRRDRFLEAIPLYTLVANDNEAPQQLREMALFLASEIVDRAKSQDAARP